ncbi:triokinase/FMN cyclase-like isoform X2 [Ylistrum balloti]|uniref:triokinase/FMN cyclase-like isoform X2 n=1 Tax=Ylistrum balloti TaxID=509963 RepID=UPI002905D309|nr:triokinase/FMN cyclase-like isoform X2 [Ylistrum balloti]
MSAACKKLINTVEQCVDENLEGLVAVNPGLQLLEGLRVVVRTDVGPNVVGAGKVSLLSGGGSGHEPAHAGYVGPGMLTAAVAGSVFASPPPYSILAGIKAVSAPGSVGCMVFIANYTGDRLNFGLAVERARHLGLRVGVVVIGEDCALATTDKTAGRRGLTGALMVMKICGALSDEGKSLEEIVTVAKDAASKMGTIGLSLTPCSIPGSGPSFHIADDEMELGLGVHGEAGVKRTKLVSAKEAVKMMIDHMTNSSNCTHLPVKEGDRVACMINNLGGTSMLELNIIAKEAIELLERRGVLVERAYCGTYITSLEMAGISITLLHLDDTLRRCLDAPTTAPAWPHPLLPPGTLTRQTPVRMPRENIQAQVTKTGPKMATIGSAEASLIFDCLKLAGERLVAAESQLNELDRESGDGDCGSTMARGAQGILTSLGSKDSPNLPVSCPGDLALTLASAAEDTMGGSSGGLYSLFFTAASASLQTKVSPDAYCEALKAGIQTMMKYGGAEPGDRTMLDPLHSASQAWSVALSSHTPLEAFRLAVEAAEKSAEETAKMKAQAGRASYVSADHLKNPDPGARAVAVWFRAVLEALSS